MNASCLKIPLLWIQHLNIFSISKILKFIKKNQSQTNLEHETSSNSFLTSETSVFAKKEVLDEKNEKTFSDMKKETT